MDKEKLITTAKTMMQSPKGILAMDESSPTIGKRLGSIGVDNNETNRVKYRELIVTTPKLSDYVSGAILFDETFHQKMSTGILFRDYLNSIGILPGIKVDKGAKDLSNHPSEKITEGLDGLRERLSEYADKGAKFCKWRAVITIGDSIPSTACIFGNTHALSRYASLCQEHSLVPIVEPEILINGNHSIQACYTVTKTVLDSLFEQLTIMDVFLEGTVLKPSMVISGTENKKRANYDDVAKTTIECLKLCLPNELAGVAFLSGGQTDEESTMHLNIMNKSNKSLPWRVTFSYARAIQQSALQSWLGKDDNIKKAQAVLADRAEKCSLASIGSL
ncbi:MAG: fructose-bisphosphate aldolase class I [Gammaproteobacteria bacterium]|nr:fructose-bisphosphate aldolase class I [Gammaproteobacteria bacterium]|tara:strand:+ start:9172 stop:10170 length:999 start_codon:yes stop_codon:yes gene_type:complete